MSYIQSLVHIVINTKNREMSINPNEFGRLFGYMISELKNNNCPVWAINGISNHIHILISLSVQKCISAVMRDLKRSTSLWMKESGYYPAFKGWSKEYAAFHVSYTHKDAVIAYILNQPEHHKKMNFETEYQKLILKNGLVYYQPPEG